MSLPSKSILKFLLAATVVGALAVLVYETAHWLTHVYESRARVQTELTKVSSREDGTITQILVREGDRVKAGQMLIQLVDEDIRLDIEALLDDLALEQAQQARLTSERTAFELELASRLEVKRTEIAARRVELKAIEDRLALAESELSRMKFLFSRKSISEKDLTAEQDRVLILKGEAALARARVDIANRELEQVAATRRQLDVIDDRIQISRLSQSRIQTLIAREKVSLGFRHIRSPIDAVVDRVYKFKGEYVEEGERILMLHDENLFWVEALIDEDQIRHVAVGQEVLIHLEAYPFDEYTGSVVQIGSATSQEMGLASSNRSQFGRPAERVPVRVSMDDPPDGLVPGMVANVTVRLHDTLRLPSVFQLYRQGTTD